MTIASPRCMRRVPVGPIRHPVHDGVRMYAINPRNERQQHSRPRTSTSRRTAESPTGRGTPAPHALAEPGLRARARDRPEIGGVTEPVTAPRATDRSAAAPEPESEPEPALRARARAKPERSVARGSRDRFRHAADLRAESRARRSQAWFGGGRCRRGGSSPVGLSDVRLTVLSSVARCCWPFVFGGLIA